MCGLFPPFFLVDYAPALSGSPVVPEQRGRTGRQSPFFLLPSAVRRRATCFPCSVKSEEGRPVLGRGRGAVGLCWKTDALAVPPPGSTHPPYLTPSAASREVTLRVVALDEGGAQVGSGCHCASHPVLGGRGWAQGGCFGEGKRAVGLCPALPRAEQECFT